MAELNDVHGLVRYLTLTFFFYMGKIIMLRKEDNQRFIMTYLPLSSNVFCLVSCLLRALLEGERVRLPDAHRRVTQHQRERIIGTVFKSIYCCYMLIARAH